MPLSEIKASSKEELISKIIEHEINKGKSKEQAAAIAYAEAKRRGYTDVMPTSMYREYSVGLGKAQRLNNVLKVPVIMAAEMVQDYAIQEIPWFAKHAKDVQFIKVLKDYTELAKAIDELKARGIDKVPFVMPHTDYTFLKDQAPKEYRDKLGGFIQDGDVKGYVKDFFADPDKRRIGGNLYLPINQHDKEFIKDVEMGRVINVSIGFMCDWDEGGEFNGIPYTLKQTNLQIGHLAGLLHGRGKCPAGICGINQDISTKTMYDEMAMHFPILTQEIFHDIAHPAESTRPPCPCSQGESDHVHSSPPTHIAVEPKYGSPDHSNNTLGESMATLEEQLADAQKEIKTLKESQVAADVKKLETSLHDAETKIATLTAVIASKDKEMEEYKEKCKKAGDEAIERYKLIADLKAKNILQLGDKAIDQVCLHDLKVAMTVLDMQLKAKGLNDKPDQTTHDAAINPIQPEPKVGAIAADAESINKMRSDSK